MSSTNVISPPKEKVSKTPKATKAKEATRKSKQATEENRWLELFSIFIHDLESPLASIKYLLKLLSENRLDLSKELHQRLVDSSQIALERSETILFDIMTVARAGTLGLPVRIGPLDPDIVIKDTITLATGSATERKIKIEYTSPENSNRVMADENLLKRSLDNLLYNAIRHTPSGDTIHVYTEETKSKFTIHIRDAGPGLGDIEPDSLFEKFGQVDLKDNGRHRGVGLGLYFCRLAATGMGGTVIAFDHADGGAVFSMMLRKAQE